MRRIFVVLSMIGWTLFGLATAITAFAAGLGGTSSGIGGMPSSPTFSGTVTSTKACAAGFSRVSPNYCKKAVFTTVDMVDGGVCTQSGSIGTTDAKAVLLAYVVQVASTNVIGLYSPQAIFYSPTDTTCASSQFILTMSVREWAAVAANTTIYILYGPTFVWKTNTSGQFYYKNSDANAQALSADRYEILGYFD